MTERYGYKTACRVIVDDSLSPLLNLVNLVVGDHDRTAAG